MSLWGMDKDVVYKVEYYSAIRMNKIEIVTLSEVNQSEISYLNAESRKKWYKWTYLQNRNWLREWIYGYVGWEGGQKYS